MLTSSFYLGTHLTGWLGSAGFRLFISRRRLAERRRLPVALAPWGLDSGGFTVLNGDGEWDITPAQYVAMVRRYRDEIGLLEWAAPMDWMCEPKVRARTGLTVAEHQRRTVTNYLQLRELAPGLPFIPVLQGWDLGDYMRCVDLYAAAGVDLATEPVVGLGSVCRRQATGEIAGIVASLVIGGLRLHGFGVKTLGLGLYGPDLVSADSMAWSYEGRRTPARCGQGQHKNEANCFRFAQAWRSRMLAGLATQQPSMWSPEESVA